MVDGDRIRLVQVVTNILNNAAKFTEPGGAIDIDAGERDGALEIRVRDSGVGISEERLPRIFDLFFQSDPSPDRAHGGLGVGLTLARRLVDLHAGTLTASSAGAGRGSEFRIALPRATAGRVHVASRLGSLRRRRDRPHPCACSWSTTTSMPRVRSNGSSR